MSGQLIPRNGGPSLPKADAPFVQQGEVDWVSLSKAVVSITVGSLTRFSGAGVQEITYVGALQLATRFKMSDVGYQRICHALEGLQVAPAFANVAYFGFGYRSFDRFLSDTASGVKFVALCASLSEAHSEDLAARIINSLWTAVGYPEDYQPSLPQFRCLVKACAGVLARSTFPETLGLMLGHHRRKLSEASDPDDIAWALQGVFDVSRSLRNRITVVGGAECSLIAALSQWLFDLKIHVEDSHGNTLFRSSPNPEQAQIHVIYKENDQLSAVMVSSSTFILAAPNELLRYMPDNRLRLIRNPLAWNTCLGHTFGQDFNDLLSLSTALGEFLGGAARIFQALAKGEPHVSVFSREQFTDYVEASHGRGFRKSMVDTFPELSDTGLLKSADLALSRNVSSAESNIDEAFLVFKRQCMCSSCHPRVTVRGGYGYNERSCLTVLAVTILQLIVTTSSIECAKELLPTANGLHYIYERNRRIWRGIKGHQGVQALAELLGLHEDQSDPGKKTPSAIMADTICLFTGYELSTPELETYSFRTAVAENGICVYLDCLESITTRPELLRRIHVIPGHIGKGDRAFDSIWDCAPIKAPFLERVSVSTAGDDINTSSDSQPPYQLKMTALVNEPSGPGRLVLYYQISAPQGQVFIQPGAISCYILRRSGLIICSKSDCDKRFSFYPYFIRTGWNLDVTLLNKLSKSGPMPDRRVFIWKHTEPSVVRLLALEIQRQSSDGIRAKAHILLRQEECLSCSVRTALQTKVPPIHPQDFPECLMHVL